MAHTAQTKSKKLPDHDVQYKVLILGESRIGKTSILKRLNNEEFTEQTISTVGIDFINVFYDIESVCVKLQIWYVLLLNGYLSESAGKIDTEF